MNDEFVGADIVPFDKQLLKGARFSCGHPDLDDWLLRYAGQNEHRNNTRTFIAVAAGSQKVVGYYATTTTRIELDEESVEFGAGKRRYPIPAILLARLAVDRNCSGCGIGRQLLVDALTRIADASRSVGFEVVVVDAIDDTAVTFYTRYGFTPFSRHQRQLFLPTKHLVATLDHS